MNLRRGVLVLAVAGLAVLPSAVALGGTPLTKKVTVGDDYYGPTKVTVKKNTTIKWVWPDDNFDSHDVKLQSGPKGVAKFHSGWRPPPTTRFPGSSPRSARTRSSAPCTRT